MHAVLQASAPSAALWQHKQIFTPSQAFIYVTNSRLANKMTGASGSMLVAAA